MKHAQNITSSMRASPLGVCLRIHM